MKLTWYEVKDKISPRLLSETWHADKIANLICEHLPGGIVRVFVILRLLRIGNGVA